MKRAARPQVRPLVANAKELDERDRDIPAFRAAINGMPVSARGTKQANINKRPEHTLSDTSPCPSA